LLGGLSAALYCVVHDPVFVTLRHLALPGPRETLLSFDGSGRLLQSNLWQFNQVLVLRFDQLGFCLFSELAYLAVTAPIFADFRRTFRDVGTGTSLRKGRTEIDLQGDCPGRFLIPRQLFESTGELWFGRVLNPFVWRSRLCGRLEDSLPRNHRHGHFIFLALDGARETVIMKRLQGFAVGFQHYLLHRVIPAFVVA